MPRNPTTHTEHAMTQSLRITVLVPPMTQVNTPYAALPHLVGLLRSWGHQVVPIDAALELALRLYSSTGLERLFAAVRAAGVPPEWAEMLANAPRYIRAISPVIAFLQGRDEALAGRIVRQAFLPQGPRFAGIAAEAEREAFGRLGQTDHARWLATLMMQDLADLARATVSPDFGLTSYGERVAQSATSYDGLAAMLATPPDPVLTLLLDDLDALVPVDVQLAVLTCPFPGNLPGALRIAQWLRRHRSRCRTVLGGGYPSTELRELSDPRPFAVLDWIVLDDAEATLAPICGRVAGEDVSLCRTFALDGSAVRYHHDPGGHSQGRFTAQPAPDYVGLDLGRYVDLLDSGNPMQRLWNEGRWLKITAAHGCYWKQCTFCDVNLPYIGRYDPARAVTLADRMDALATQTGRAGFHFTDEAAPPALLLQLALELLRRGRCYHWWGNVRFDGYFTPERCRILAAAGMVAVSGGIEVADDAVLERIKKGVDVAQAARVTHAFASAGILVHAYLMYGFPGQDAQQTIDSLEIVRQLMVAGCLHSGFWHRFTATVHAPVGKDPDGYGIIITGPPRGGFAWNNLEHVEPGGADHDALGPGLTTALAAWMRGEDLERPLPRWFSGRVPKPRQPPDRIAAAIAAASEAPGERVLWLGESPTVAGKNLVFTDETGSWVELAVPGKNAASWAELLRAAMPGAGKQVTVQPYTALLPALTEHGLVRY